MNRQDFLKTATGEAVMADDSLSELLVFAKETAWDAGRFTLSYFQTGVEVELKADSSPVTAADRGAEERMVARIRSRYPEDAILGEEFGDRPGTSGRRWIVDPIDGTKSFVHGVPLYGVMIGIEVDDNPAVGVVYMPALDEMYAAATGLGCEWNGRPARVSAVDGLDNALVAFTDWDMSGYGSKAGRFRALVDGVAYSRGWGDCYAHLLVATGRAEVAVDQRMNVWDCAALAPIVREAGGTFTDWKGISTIRGDDAVSTNGVLFEDVMERIGE